MSSASPPGSAFAMAVAPSGTPYVRAAEEGDLAIEGATGVTIAAAFDRGAGAGILHLGAVEVATPLPRPFRLPSRSGARARRDGVRARRPRGRA